MARKCERSDSATLNHQLPRISDVVGKRYSMYYASTMFSVVTAKVVGRLALHLAPPPSVEGREPACHGGIFDLESLKFNTRTQILLRDLDRGTYLG